MGSIHVWIIKLDYSVGKSRREVLQRKTWRNFDAISPWTDRVGRDEYHYYIYIYVYETFIIVISATRAEIIHVLHMNEWRLFVFFALRNRFEWKFKGQGYLLLKYTWLLFNIWIEQYWSLTVYVLQNLLFEFG